MHYVGMDLVVVGPLILAVVTFGVPLYIAGGRHRPLNYRSFEVIPMKLTDLPPQKDGDVTTN